MKPQESILGVLVRDLRALQRELEAYGEEDVIWETPAGIGNSAGTLVLHLTGNLQSFVGATLGGVQVKTLDFLIHLSTHLAFHVGQVDYHRRLVTGDIESIGPVPISELTSVQATD